MGIKPLTIGYKVSNMKYEPRIVEDVEGWLVKPNGSDWQFMYTVSYKCELNVQNVPLYQFENQTNPPFASCFHLELAHSKAKRN